MKRHRIDLFCTQFIVQCCLASFALLGLASNLDAQTAVLEKTVGDQVDKKTIEESFVDHDEAIAETEKTRTDNDNPGLSFMDQALEEKLKATSVQDIGRVIALAQRARKEGLSGENLKFCDELIASEQLERGLILAQSLIGKTPNDLEQGWKIARTRILNDLESAVKVFPGQPRAFLCIAQLNMIPEGDMQRAGEALDIAERLGRDDPAIYSQAKILKAMLEKDPLKQEAIIAEASKTNPNPRLLLLLAKSQMDLKQFDKALQTLEKTLELEPDNLQALVAVFSIYMETDKHDKALKTLDVLDEKAPNDGWKFERAKILATMGRNDESIELLDKLREKNTRDPAILGLRGAVHFEMNDYDKAMKDVDAALRLDPKLLAPRVLKAQILLARKQPDEAIAMLEEIRKDNPENEQIAVSLSQVYVAQKQFDKAQSLIGSLAEKSPKEEKWSLLKAQIMIAGEQPVKAVEFLERQFEENPDSTRIRLMLVTLLADQKQSRKALEILEPLIEKDPAAIELLRLKGSLLLSVNRHLDAVKVLEKIVEAAPKDEVSINNLSWLLSTSPIDMVRDGNRALELAKQACELSNYKKAYILSTLAAAYAETGDFDKALEWIRKSIDMAGEDDNVKDRIEELEKELDSYKKRRPYREAIEENGN